jgi:hypothetical protein
MSDDVGNVKLKRAPRRSRLPSFRAMSIQPAGTKAPLVIRTLRDLDAVDERVYPSRDTRRIRERHSRRNKDLGHARNYRFDLRSIGHGTTAYLR